jgi:hypothetical protein
MLPLLLSYLKSRVVVAVVTVLAIFSGRLVAETLLAGCLCMVGFLTRLVAVVMENL